MFKWISDRAKERSTWLGLIAIAAAAGLKISPEMAEQIITLGLAAGGLLAATTKG